MVERSAMKHTQETLDTLLENGTRDFSGCDLSGLSFKKYSKENLSIFAEMNLDESFFCRDNNLDFEQLCLASLKGAYMEEMIVTWGITLWCEKKKYNYEEKVCLKEKIKSFSMAYKETNNGEFLLKSDIPFMIRGCSMKSFQYLKPCLDNLL